MVVYLYHWNGKISGEQSFENILKKTIFEHPNGYGPTSNIIQDNIIYHKIRKIAQDEIVWNFCCTH